MNKFQTEKSFTSTMENVLSSMTVVLIVDGGILTSTILFIFPITRDLIEGGAGAVGAPDEKSTTKSKNRTANVHRGQRKPKTIKIESFRNKDVERAAATEAEGLLPSSSRETTPLNEPTQPLQIDDKGFFSGNPFVEVTKGIIHMYKNK